ncbi:WYL domain-containing protein [Paenibacillus sp. UNC496MF]|uniref:WYL domain-containing protein n=1 Tax=Paenibacillus sp. UNC496MF TaxID=1502753 RepID=UPI000AF74120
METERKLESMGLFLKGYVWYAYGYCLTLKDFRVFRVSRIGELKIFCEAGFFAARCRTTIHEQADFKKVQAVLRFQPEMKTRVCDEFGFDQ